MPLQVRLCPVSSVGGTAQLFHGRLHRAAKGAELRIHAGRRRDDHQPSSRQIPFEFGRQIVVQFTGLTDIDDDHYLVEPTMAGQPENEINGAKCLTGVVGVGVVQDDQVTVVRTGDPVPGHVHYDGVSVREASLLAQQCLICS